MAARDLSSQNKHLTFKANRGVGRHGWLRLTPAYGVAVVRERIPSQHDAGYVVLDPFSGTGTTPLVAAETGAHGLSLDVNPFLVWLGNSKLYPYEPGDIERARVGLEAVLDFAVKTAVDSSLWQPNIFKIEKWWNPTNLAALKGIRAGIDELEPSPWRNLLEVALCRTLIEVSNAAFNHQSMSFKDVGDSHDDFNRIEFVATLQRYRQNLETILESASVPLAGTGEVRLADARQMGELAPSSVQQVVTSPPYVNRMSYIRELRPYMYWLRFLDQAADAGELDWEAIGGTWGTATSKLGKWEPPTEPSPIGIELQQVKERIREAGSTRSGDLLAIYVEKYFADMWEHFRLLTPVLEAGAPISYVVGNSTFFGEVVPAQDWYAEMLRELGYRDVNVEVIRKRNSNKALFEYDVTGFAP